MRRILLAVSLLVSALSFAQAGDAQDALWSHRDEPGVLAKLEALSAAELSAHPSSFEALWRAARLKQWLADGETETARKQALGKEAWALGDRAREANPKAVQGYYYAALGIGAYSQGAGIMRALGEGLESKFNERLDTAIKLDPKFQCAGGLVAKGRYWFELPWPKRKLAKSVETLERAISVCASNLRAYVYLAETQLKDGDAKKAQATLVRAQTGDITYDPADGRRAKKMAEGVQAEIAKESK